MFDRRRVLTLLVPVLILSSPAPVLAQDPIAPERRVETQETTRGCPDLSKRGLRAEHAFTRASLEGACGRGVGAVVAHSDLGDMPGYHRELHHWEHAPILVAAEHSKGEMSTEELRAVLSGSVDDWSQIGRGEGPIHVYWNAGERQTEAWRTLLRERLGLEDVEPRNLRTVGAPAGKPENYRRLARAATKDPNALVLGLSDVEVRGLATESVDGVRPLGVEGPDYALSTPVYLYWRDDAAGQDARERVLLGLTAWDAKLDRVANE